MGGSTKTTQKNTIDPTQLATLNANYQGAQNRAATVQPYTGELVPSFNPTQLQAQGILGNLATSNVGDQALANATTGANNVINYNPNQVSANNVNAGLLSNTNLQPYLNPYQNDVINSTLTQLNQQRGQQRVADNQAATQANAFGGSRQGVADALTNQYYDQDTAATLAGLNSANFAQAQGAASTDLGRQLAAAQGNQSANLTASQANTNAGLTANAQSLAGSGLLSNLSAQQLGQAQQKGGILNTVGDIQQQQQQATDTANWQRYLQSLGIPVEQQQLLNSALGLIPVQQTITSKQSQPFLQQLAGILGATGALGQGLGSMGFTPGAGGAGGAIGGASAGGPLAGGGAASTAADAFAFSDARMKENITTAGYDAKGRRWVDFNYKGDHPANRVRGVLAQEVMHTDPHAVAQTRGGLLAVNYSKLKAA